MNRAADWMKQAQSDLAAARALLSAGHFEWAAFVAQQAAEKALKGLLMSNNQRAFGHSLTALLKQASTVAASEEKLLDCARRLDAVYVVARYPNGWPAGTPAEQYSRQIAEDYVTDAEQLIKFAESHFRSAK